MAIRLPGEGKEITINVYLKNGEHFLDKDITDSPFGESERVVAFWDGDLLVTYPLSEVRRIEFNFK